MKIRISGPIIAFTLIELLITISIIAILASMLLPSLQKARGKAKELKCAANLKQLGTAFFMYADEHDGYLPVSGGSPNRWCQTSIPPYTNDKGQRTPLYLCPSDSSKYNPTYYSTVSYGYKIPLHGKKLSKQNKPSLALLLCDNADTGDGNTPYDVSWYYATNGILALAKQRHSGGINICFLDGHMKFWRTSIPTSSSDDFWLAQ
ncbi:MAG: hypothetical protein A2017_21745 [Lentisphaerae bacterium GWF2_44_16]|nr:MAG: hypothetical protein A2017_21745 [Lentisphaerae bacterium GWF2_44_16]